ncbi:YodC family protein [Vibrio vulnificus]|uniref:YodC family protein n=1 Tax=Vibrio diabolicus TaxID=50719 RepID=UPI00215F9195|nr:YodC family protein [Vibrio diabolicus]MCS0363253.1 YodC family protein [Vibrio diabolicus]
MSFKTGDIVKLKSGGPDMTIQGKGPAGYWCQWFAGKKLERGQFPADSLEHA